MAMVRKMTTSESNTELEADGDKPTNRHITRAQEIFRSSSQEHKELIKRILEEERDVMHLKRRSDIHQRIYDHIMRAIK